MTTTGGHCGAQTATEEVNVKRNVERLFGPGAFGKIRPFGRFLHDGAGEICSDPTQKYILVVPNEVIDAVYVTSCNWIVTQFEGIEPWRLSVALSQPSFRSEEHTSELQSLMRISYAAICLKTKNINH